MFTSRLQLLLRVSITQPVDRCPETNKYGGLLFSGVTGKSICGYGSPTSVRCGEATTGVDYLVLCNKRSTLDMRMSAAY